MGPDRTNFKSYFVLDRNFAVATRPTPFRPTFALPAKSVLVKNTIFALEGYNRFMKPSWVRAHGLIFGKVYIVWVCAPPYSPLSSPRSRIRENSALKFGPNFVTHSGGIFYPVVFFNSVHPVASHGWRWPALAAHGQPCLFFWIFMFWGCYITFCGNLF